MLRYYYNCKGFAGKQKYECYGVIMDMIDLTLKDEEWPFTFTDHERLIARAVLFDDRGYFYFCRIERNDEFGNGCFIETSGGGVEMGETLIDALQRELKEELGAEVEVLEEIGIVRDYYNLIHRRNINHYFLCRLLSFGQTDRRRDEIEDLHLSALKVTYDEAVSEYQRCRSMKLGRLLAARELPILADAMKIIKERQL